MGRKERLQQTLAQIEQKVVPAKCPICDRELGNINVAFGFLLSMLGSVLGTLLVEVIVAELS